MNIIEVIVDFFVIYSNAILLVLLSLLVIIGSRYVIKQHRLLNYISASFDKPYRDLELPSVPWLLRPLQSIVAQYHMSDQALFERDKLTNLINRTGFKRAFSKHQSAHQGCLILLDVCQFRFINDLFGFPFGDQVLMTLSRRITRLNDKPVLVARMNGNEFLMYYSKELNSEAIIQLLSALEWPYQINGQKIELALKAGVVNLSEHRSDISSILRRLDLALQKAKLAHQTLAFYQHGEDQQHIREVTLARGFAKAMANDEFYLLYQPKFCLNSGKVTQVEALLRWRHQELGVVGPNEFIHIAERIGIMGQLSRWVIKHVIEQMAQWQAQEQRLQVALNLSASDFENDSLIADLQQLLNDNQVKASDLIIEITENAMMASLSRSIKVLNQLKGLGVGIAIDDFGTGQSSLAYLRHLPADEIKIDKAFLSDFEHDDIAKQIIKTTVKLAQQLGLKVTVEGVESKVVSQYLLPLGVDYLQGNLIAAPQPPELVPKAVQYVSQHTHLHEPLTSSDPKVSLSGY